MPTFYPGHDRPRGASALDRMMIAAHNVTAGLAGYEPGAWMLDSGGFTIVTRHGEYDTDPGGYVRFVSDLAERFDGLVCAFQQDYPATEAVAEATTGPEHYAPGHVLEGTLAGCAMKTRSRWLHTADASAEQDCPVPIVPVLQGEGIGDYVEHLALIRHTLQSRGASGSVAGTPPRIGIGALKGRSPAFVRELMLALDQERRRHGRSYRFHALGIGKKYVRHAEAGPAICRLVDSYDSAAWKVRARYAGADQNTTDFANQYAQDLKPTAPLFQ
jgi:hypothetical protein